MLKRIPKHLSPSLMKVLLEMGHGDEIVLADGHYPAASNAQNLIRCDGLGIPDLLKSVLEFFPLDTYVNASFFLMAVAASDHMKPEIWETYEKILNESSGENKTIEKLERFEFYERGKKAYAIVATGETAIYANILLRKGVVQSPIKAGE